MQLFSNFKIHFWLRNHPKTFYFQIGSIPQVLETNKSFHQFVSMSKVNCFLDLVHLDFKIKPIITNFVEMTPINHLNLNFLDFEGH